ncbi:MAG: glycosyltransferase family 2 protein [Chloroflexota bacterium]|nr:glycosyltransferase family 2 protein [Chloroflexota bacterium]MDP6758257.1 glycosyltransferase family 2 protein [Chloroflexota bacterium]
MTTADSLADLSIVVPAYNESDRLPGTLAAIAEHYGNAATAPEIILVDDGSDDDTLQLMESWCASRADAHAISIPHAGKAHAVRAGVERAGRDRVLFMDADLAVPLTEVPLLTTALDAGADIAIGSREIPGSRRDAESLIRHSRGRLFNWFVSVFTVRGIKDTQCGFKAFATPVIRQLFQGSRLYSQPPTRLNGPSVTAFDVELLFLAGRMGYSITEIPVQWRHVPGSKVDSLRDPLRMALEVLCIRFNALIGRYP